MIIAIIYVFINFFIELIGVVKFKSYKKIYFKLTRLIIIIIKFEIKQKKQSKRIKVYVTKCLINLPNQIILVLLLFSFEAILLKAY